MTQLRRIFYLDYESFSSQGKDKYIVMAFEHYSQRPLPVGQFDDMNPEIFLQIINGFMTHPGFLQSQAPFELVTYRFPELADQINEIIKPHNGYLTLSEGRTIEGMGTFFNKLMDVYRR